LSQTAPKSELLVFIFLTRQGNFKIIYNLPTPFKTHMLIDDYLDFTISALATEVASAAHYRAIARFFRISTNWPDSLLFIAAAALSFLHMRSIAASGVLWRRRRSGEVAKGAARLRFYEQIMEKIRAHMRGSNETTGWLISS
jgi:hypothetical protein